MPRNRGLESERQSPGIERGGDFLGARLTRTETKTEAALDARPDDE